MIKRIYHIADLHIPNDESQKPYTKMLQGFIEQLATDISQYNTDECRIIVAGDIFHNKIKISNEAGVLYYRLLNSLNILCKTYILAGNHDMLENNHDRMDSIAPPFYIHNAYPNVIYVDKTLGYKSGCILDDNILWACYSMHDNFVRPDITNAIAEHPDKTVIGLYHGDIVGSVTDIGRVSENGIDFHMFDDCDCVMAGHIHKHQEIRKNGIRLVYAGSLFQQDFGENVSGHGYVVWDIENMTYKHVEVDSPQRMFKFTISDYDDIDNDIERLINM